MKRLFSSLAFLILSVTAQGLEVAADYQAGVAGNPALAPSPSTQGWTAVSPTSDLANFTSAAVSPDGSSGLNAWRMLDGSTVGSQFLYWSKPLTSQQLTDAMAYGFRLVSHMRLVDPVPSNAGTNSVYIYFANNAGRRWIVFLDINAAGQIVASPQGGTVTTLAGVDATQYHTHEITYDSVTQSAEYRVDGAAKLSGWAGTTGTANGVRFGTESSGGRGEAFYNRVSFVINDPPPPPAPTVTLHPASQSVAEGASAVLTATFANATPPFQWYKDTQALAGQTGATLTLPAVTPADAGDYWCRATNASGVASTATAAVSALAASKGLVITEFLAENDGGLRDSDGQREDWIELQNLSTTDQNTTGYYLTDNAALPAKWALPAVVVPPGGFLLVWASGKNRAIAGSELHTNFSLQNVGGYLALVKPDLTVASAYTYPEQFADHTYGINSQATPQTKFFTVATPLALNVDGQTSVRDGISLTPTPGTFTNSIAVMASTTLSGGSLRHTTNGGLPEFDSPLFGLAQTLTASAQLRVALLYPGERYGATATAAYLKLAADVSAFQSPLPVLIMSNHGAGAIPGTTARGPNGDGSAVVNTPLQPQTLTMLDVAAGDTAMTSPVVHRSRAGMKVRGSSSFTFAEKSYSLETWAERDRTERKLALLGLPEDADWVIYGPDPAQFDNTLIHNTLTFDMARLAGFPAPRYRFVELFIDTGGDLTMADHRGLAILLEKPTRGGNRVDFAYPNNAGTTGGWMINVDRMDSTTSAAPVPKHFHTAGPDGILQTPDDNPRGFQAITVPGGTGSGSGITPANDDMPNFYHSFFNFESPAAESLTAAQRSGIQTSLRSFDTALYGPNYTDATAGYWPHIDVPNWATHLVLNCFVKNQDAIVLSSFLTKRSPTSRIEWASVWDIDRSFDRNISNGAAATANLTWAHDRLFYRRLVTDPEFMQAYIDQWQRLRSGPWSSSALTALVDAQSAAITSTVAARSGLTTAAWTTNLSTMKTWLTDRAAAMDGQFIAAPVLSHVGGNVPSGFPLSMTGGPEIYFTTDGTDPRLRGGTPATSATLYTAAVALTQPTIIQARIRNGTSWSGLVSGSYFPPQDFAALRVTEIYYNPPGQLIPAMDGDEFEFLEMKNTGSAPLNVSGLTFAGIAYTIPPDTTIAPGGFYVIVSNVAAFSQRFPGCVAHGTYTDRLSNGGEDIMLLRGTETVWSISYDDAPPWRLEADNGGNSLQRPDPKSPGYDPATWTAATPTPCADLSLTDSDSDLMADYWEPLHGLQVGVADGTADADSDGQTNAQEYAAATDPNDSGSLLELLATQMNATGTTLEFTAVAGKSYAVRVSSDLQTWTTLQAFPANTATRTEQVLDAAQSTRRFYYVKTPLE